MLESSGRRIAPDGPGGRAMTRGPVGRRGPVRDEPREDESMRRVPLLALWGEQGPLGSVDVIAVWSAWAADVRGAALPCGHHLPEEAPAETYAALRAFLAPG